MRNLCICSLCLYLISFMIHCSFTNSSENQHCQGTSPDLLSCGTNDFSTSEETRSTESSALAVVPYEPEKHVLSRFHEHSRTFNFAGQSLAVSQDWNTLGVAGVVWDAAVVLCRYLEAGKIEVQGKNVIELGAGSGIVGIVAALLGGNVTITEKEVAIPYLQSVVEENVKDKSEVKVKVKQLDWVEDIDKFSETYDIILGADVIYIEEVFPALLRTLTKLSHEKTKIYLSCRIRYDRDKKFLNMLKEKFVVSKVFMDVETDIRIYKAIKK